MSAKNCMKASKAFDRYSASSMGGRQSKAAGYSRNVRPDGVDWAADGDALDDDST
jgi:hypothetical protein